VFRQEYKTFLAESLLSVKFTLSCCWFQQPRM